VKLQSIQILRGLAALLVVIYHIRAMEVLAIANNGLAEPPLLNGLVTNGYAGVDLFFVISGFIMVHVTANMKAGPLASLEFLFARITRIYPLWWIFAGLMTLMFIAYNGLGFGAGWERVSQGEPLIPYMIKSFALAPQNAHPVLGVGWTLVHEVYFYLVFALILLLPRRFWLWALSAWGAGLIAATFFGLTHPYGKDLLTLAVYPMTMEFIMGAVVGIAVSSGLAWRGGLVTLLATLWLVASLCFQGIEDDHLMMWGRVVWFGIPCALLVYGVATLDHADRRIWLLPAAAGLITATGISLAYNLDSDSAVALRLGATVVSVLVGAVIMLAVLWAGWIGGRLAPQETMDLAAPLRLVHDGFARLGDWSFSLYLCHPRVLAPIRIAFDAFDNMGLLPAVFRLGHPGPIDNLLLNALALTACLIAAWLSYTMFERPMIRGTGALRRMLFSRRAPVAVTA
jgi:peptidoglycan/LPS O-acetylase OafA/YrhL